MGSVQIRGLQNCTSCKETAQESYGEIKAVVVDYATAITETFNETDHISKDIALKIEVLFDDNETVVYTKKNDISRVGVEEIKNQAQAITDNFKSRNLNVLSKITLDLGHLERNILRQFEMDKFEESKIR